MSVPGWRCGCRAGTAIIEELEKLAKETEFAAGYERVRTPNLARENLYLTSGHLPYYADSMFPPMELDDLFPGRVGVSPAVSGVSPETSGRAVHTKRRRLPHFEKPWAIYFVTLSTWNRRELSPAARTIVLNAFKHFNGKRYELFAVCVMPDHAHFLIQPWIKERTQQDENVFWPLSELMHSIKSFSAKEINKVEGTAGEVWTQERYDRFVRGDKDLEEKICVHSGESTKVRPTEF